MWCRQAGRTCACACHPALASDRTLRWGCVTPVAHPPYTTPTPNCWWPDMGAITTEGLRKSFGQVQALRGVSLDVPSGSFYVVLGPPGAAKTTTLRAIAGLERLDGGSVHLDGLDATLTTPAARDLA